MRRVVLLGGALLCAGCFGPKPDPSRFFHLTPAGDEASGSVTATVGLGPVSIPAYLDRPQMVTRVDANQVSISEADRWAEPLRENVARVLAEDLARASGLRDVVAYPWPASAGVDLAVAVTFSSFEADSTGAVHLDADWTLTDPESGTVVTRTRSQLDEQAAPVDASGTVAAMSRVLARLGEAIGQAVRQAGR